jgi:MFS family permease
MSRLPRSVWLLGWVSLATDAATEAIYPLLPFFLTRVLGAGAVSLGVVEGAAEAVSGLLKIASGRLADRSRAKRPLVLIGYGISSLARPFISVTTRWSEVLAVRLLDRIGKGIRTAPRDAMLALFATPQTHGRIYGFHRAMDHAGAIIGPLAGTLFLLAYPDRYRTLFALTIVPGVIAVVLIFFVPEESAQTIPGGLAPLNDGQAPRGALPAARDGRSERRPPGARHVMPGAGEEVPGSESNRLPRAFTRFMIVLALFTLGNSTDAFLLLRLTDAAGTVRYVPLMWAALHAVKASVSAAAGGWSDRIGRRKVIAAGWCTYATVYVGFALSERVTALLAWFLLYGLYFGFAEGTERALVADLAPAARRGFAFGIYNAVTGLGALGASVVFGVVWAAYGPAAAFGLGAALAFAATTLLFVTI